MNPSVKCAKLTEPIPGAVVEKPVKTPENEYFLNKIRG